MAYTTPPYLSCAKLRETPRRWAKRRGSKELHPPTLSMHPIMTRLTQALQVLRVEGVASVGDLDLVMNQCRSCYYTSS